MAFRRFAFIAVPAAAVLTVVGSFSPAHAATNNVVNGHCSGRSVYSLQVQRESPTQLSIDWGVDMARHTAGVAWTYAEANNGAVFTKGTVKTIADGSWSKTVMIRAAAKNKITATAKNPATGETCSATATA